MTTTTARRAQFHPLSITRVRSLTEDAIEVTLAVPEELRGHYAYQPGQFVAVRSRIDDEQVRRSYSICQAPVVGELKVAIKRGTRGLFSAWAHDVLCEGMQLDVMSPDGMFVSRLAERDHRHFAAVAAGSGITPILALIEDTLTSSATSTFSLLFSNRTTRDTMFVDELAALKDRFPSRLALLHVLTRERRNSELLSGRLDSARLEAVFDGVLHPDSVDEWFLCGPLELVQLCRDALAERGVEAPNIHFELFSTGDDTGPGRQSGRPIVVQPGQDVHTVQFRLDGTTSTVTTPVRSEESILNAALRVRSDVPFACTGGVCGTCRAAVREGTVNMKQNYALEPDEVERGYVLTCQSVPTSERVTVDYDV